MKRRTTLSSFSVVHSFSGFLPFLFASFFIHLIWSWRYIYRSRVCQTWNQFSHSVVSDSLQPHGVQHARLPCPSPTPGVHSNSCPLCWWCHPTISSFVIPFFSCLQSFPASGSLYLFLTFFALSPSVYSILIHICYANIKIPSIVPNILPSLTGKKQILPKKEKKSHLRTCVKQSINSLYTEGLKKCKV